MADVSTTQLFWGRLSLMNDSFSFPLDSQLIHSLRCSQTNSLKLLHRLDWERAAAIVGHTRIGFSIPNVDHSTTSITRWEIHRPIGRKEMNRSKLLKRLSRSSDRDFRRYSVERSNADRRDLLALTTRYVNLCSLKTFVCPSSVEVDTGDRLLSAGPLDDVRTESDDGLPLRSAEWISMRASYFAQLLQFFLKRLEAV
jgi:hypothetical protein